LLRFSPRSADSRSDRAVQWLLTTSWLRFLTVLTAFYASSGLLFAGLFLVSGGSAPGRPQSLAEALLHSLQALTVFGCGRLAPVTAAAKGVTVAAVFLGWLALILALALVMVRFISLRPFWRPLYGAELESAITDMEPKTRERVDAEYEVRKRRPAIWHRRPIPQPDQVRAPL
jgi:hypothetical protein